jgi:demethylmenaquinone methyltransferase/2-methoxy-6-polyprenyl-1,4-benzoquinol methylase
MLEIAKNNATGLENIDFVAADALNLPFEDAEFDACFISFGLRNLDDLKKGLMEMKRVTKKGGFVVNIDTGKPKGILKVFHQLYFFHIVPIIGRIFNGNSTPYKYLPQSTEKFPTQDELVHIFQELGLSDVEKFDFLFGAISQQVGKV